jgi:hypothetical protein
VQQVLKVQQVFKVCKDLHQLAQQAWVVLQALKETQGVKAHKA